MPCLLLVECCLHNNPTAAEARLFHYISKKAQQIPHTAGMQPVRNDSVKKKNGTRKSPALKKRAWGTRKGQRCVTREATPGRGDVGGKAAGTRRTPKKGKRQNKRHSRFLTRPECNRFGMTA